MSAAVTFSRWELESRDDTVIALGGSTDCLCHCLLACLLALLDWPPLLPPAATATMPHRAANGMMRTMMRLLCARFRSACKLFHWDNETWRQVGKGEARILERETSPAVRFIMIGEDGTVGSPSRQFVWALTHTSHMPPRRRF